MPYPSNPFDDAVRFRKFNRHPGLIVILPSVSAARQIDLLTRVLRFIDDQITVVDQLVQIDKHGVITMRDWTAQEN